MVSNIWRERNLTGLDWGDGGGGQCWVCVPPLPPLLTSGKRHLGHCAPGLALSSLQNLNEKDKDAFNLRKWWVLSHWRF